MTFKMWMPMSNEFFMKLYAAFKASIDLVVQSSGVGYVNPKLRVGVDKSKPSTQMFWGVPGSIVLAYNLFKKQQFGQLVGISSIASLRGNRSAPDYFASKAYQKAYLESLYIKTKSIRSEKVFITDIRPGFVDTPMALGEAVFLDGASRESCKADFFLPSKRKNESPISPSAGQLIACALQS